MDATTGHAPIDDGSLPDPFALPGRGGGYAGEIRRSLLRVAIVAAGAAQRYARDGLEGDPVAWMLAPRAAFDGDCALDACTGLTGFTRAIALNAPGTGLGLDADPRLLDRLRAAPRRQRRRPPQDPLADFRPDAVARSGPVSLFTTTFVAVDDDRQIVVFAAAFCTDETSFRFRLFERFGMRVARGASVVKGLRTNDRIVRRLVSDAAAARLLLLDDDDLPPASEGFDLLVEERGS